MTVKTFYPSLDGYTHRDVGPNPATETWATIIAGVGTNSSDSNPVSYVQMNASLTSGGWNNVRRVIFLFDTSELGAGAVVTAAVLSLVGHGDKYQNLQEQSFSVFASNPASDTAIVNSDYNVARWGSTHLSNDITYTNFVDNQVDYNDFTLNSDGRALVSVTGLTKLGIRHVRDADAQAPAWGSDDASYITIEMSEEAVSGDKRPKLVVTWTPPPFIPQAIMF